MSDAQDAPHPLARTEGRAFLTASEILLKGLLEADRTVDLVTGPREGTFASFFVVAAEEPVAQLLQTHSTTIYPTPTAARGVRLAMQAAKGGGQAVALVPAAETEHAIAEIVAARAQAEPGRGGAVCLLLEQDPAGRPWQDPLAQTRGLDLPCVEAMDVQSLRESIETAHLLSRAAARPAVVFAHRRLLLSGDTVACLPNRITEQTDVEAMLHRRGRRIRVHEGDDVLRVARRLELSRLRNLPSPGEVVEIGFIVSGPAAMTLRHLVNEFQLAGRMPILELELVRPLDDSVVSRFLLRCRSVVVLESRPGGIEREVLAVAEKMRRRGEQPASVWGRTLPPGDDGVSAVLDPDDAPSITALAHKIAHLLPSARLAGDVAERWLRHHDPIAGDASGAWRANDAALPAFVQTRVWAALQDLEQWFKEGPDTPDAEDPAPVAVEDVPEGDRDRRVVPVEVWNSPHFAREGTWAVRQAATDSRPRIFIVSDVPRFPAGDLDRLARAAVPVDQMERVRTVSLDETASLSQALKEAARNEGVHILIVRGEADAASPERSETFRQREEIDRLGFEPAQRLVRSLQAACAIRPAGQMLPGPDEIVADREPPRYTMDRFSGRGARGVGLRIRPRFEVIEVLRTRPPVSRWPLDESPRLSPPQPLHGRDALWRAHLSGLRGAGLGLATRVLCDAGRAMGYHVRSLVGETGPGSTEPAWSQVLFTHPRENEEPLPATAAIPPGDADLLLVAPHADPHAPLSDPIRTVMHIDRTHAVVDSSRFEIEPAEQNDTEQRRLDAVIAACTCEQPRLTGDIARLCRATFGTDRLADMIILGAAFQLGMIPVSLDAIEQSVRKQQQRGFGRSTLAFQFGRRLAADPTPLERTRDVQTESCDLMLRRITLSMRKQRGGAYRSRIFQRLVHDLLAEMPGLRETDEGRAACRDLVVACSRCQLWGGADHVRQFRDLVLGLYVADRGDRGRSVTRHAILPLADAMLLRDNLYLARLATSAEQRQRLRARLRVRRPRGDEVTRRYVNRVEAIAFGRRYRLDFTSSDWTAYAIKGLLAWIPARWRGNRRSRERREYLIDLVRRAAINMHDEYADWDRAMRNLQTLSLQGRLHRLSTANLRQLIEPPPAAEAAAGVGVGIPGGPQLTSTLTSSSSDSNP